MKEILESYSRKDLFKIIKEYNKQLKEELENSNFNKDIKKQIYQSRFIDVTLKQKSGLISEILLLEDFFKHIELKSKD
tara:strand:+ start:1526 stop:1759 length:234 start_codon:yes stop_codon:yes gene_type:complete